MKKLLGFPPAMIFMLIDHWCKIETTPENDIMGNITQLMLKALTNETAMYLECYEFFEKSMFLGAPDYVPEAAVDGDIRVIQTAFGLFDSSLLNVSMVKPGRVTCSRLKYLNGEYYMHVYTGTGKTPPPWNEFGWDDPAPQPPSLEVFPDCGVEEFAQKVSSQYVIVTYGDDTEALMDLCDLLDIEVIKIATNKSSRPYAVDCFSLQQDCLIGRGVA